MVGQGAMGLLWYHHILQLIEGNVEYHNSQLHILPSKTLQPQILPSKTLPLNLSLNGNDSNSAKQQYCFTDQNNLTHNGNIHYAQTENIEQADVVFLCVKSFQISSALKNIADSLKKNSAIILAHNGMGTLAELPKELESKHSIYTLLTTHGSLRSSPLCITHTGVGSSDIGLLLGASHLNQQQSLTQLLNAALPSVNFHPEIKDKQWLKLAINCVINPLTAINNVNNGTINSAIYQDSIIRLLEEIIAVANTEGVMLDLSELKQKAHEVAQATAKNCSSMRCDVLAKRRSEIDYINGYIHHLGIKHNIATPENTKMWQAVKSIEAKY